MITETVFQVDVGNEEPERGKNQDEKKSVWWEITIEEVHGTFKIRKKVSPPSIIYDDKKDDDLLRWCWNRDSRLQWKLEWLIVEVIQLLCSHKMTRV